MLNISADSARTFFKRKRYEYDFKNLAERELFLWAILFNRRELGKMMWRAGQDQLGNQDNKYDFKCVFVEYCKV